MQEIQLSADELRQVTRLLTYGFHHMPADGLVAYEERQSLISVLVALDAMYAALPVGLGVVIQPSAVWMLPEDQ